MCCVERRFEVLHIWKLKILEHGLLHHKVVVFFLQICTGRPCLLLSTTMWHGKDANEAAGPQDVRLCWTGDRRAEALPARGITPQTRLVGTAGVTKAVPGAS